MAMGEDGVCLWPPNPFLIPVFEARWEAADTSTARATNGRHINDPEQTCGHQLAEWVWT